MKKFKVFIILFALVDLRGLANREVPNLTKDNFDIGKILDSEQRSKKNTGCPQKRVKQVHKVFRGLKLSQIEKKKKNDL